MNPERFGLSPAAFEKLYKLLKQFEEFKQIKLFGSRALGTYREGSDIDLAIFGKSISYKTLRTFKIKYEDLNLPYSLDLIHYEGIENKALKKHIDQYGIEI